FSTYYNNRQVQDYLGVNKEWTLLNSQVLAAFAASLVPDHKSVIGKLLNGGLRVRPVLVYSGDQDYVYNWIGSRAMTLATEWSGQGGFNKAHDVIYKDQSGKQIGKLRSYTDGESGQLNFMQVFGGSHNAAADEPKGVLMFLQDFISGQLHDSPGDTPGLGTDAASLDGFVDVACQVRLKSPRRILPT
ncbi:hypothetical protein FOL47_002555, partial [Perkinsus chesapeaki]